MKQQNPLASKVPIYNADFSKKEALKNPLIYKKLITFFIAIIISLCLLIGIYLAINWQEDLPIEKLKASWQLPTSQFIDMGTLSAHVGLTPSCQDTTKPKIVMLHGTAASLHTWEGWTQGLQDTYCVVRMDLPGFGLTGPYLTPNNPMPPQYTAEHYVDFVVAVMDKLHINSATLIGNSLGGKVAWLTATTHSSRVKALILVDANGYGGTPLKVPLAFRLAQHPSLDSITAHILPKSLVKKSLESVYADPTKITDSTVTRYYELTLREGNRQVLPKRMREFSPTSHQSEIDSIHVPTLILWGQQDQLIPVSDAYLFQQHIPHSELHIFPDLGHIPQEENPQETLPVVEEFLSRNSVVVK